MSLNVSQTQTPETLADGTNCREIQADTSSVAGNWQLFVRRRKEKAKKIVLCEEGLLESKFIGFFSALAWSAEKVKHVEWQRTCWFSHGSLWIGTKILEVRLTCKIYVSSFIYDLNLVLFITDWNEFTLCFPLVTTINHHICMHLDPLWLPYQPHHHLIGR